MSHPTGVEWDLGGLSSFWDPMGNLSTVIGQSIAHYTNERTGHGTGPRCTGFPFHPGEHRMAEGLGLRLELPQVRAAQTEPSDQHENT